MEDGPKAVSKLRQFIHTSTTIVSSVLTNLCELLKVTVFQKRTMEADTVLWETIKVATRPVIFFWLEPLANRIGEAGNQ